MPAVGVYRWLVFKELAARTQSSERGSRPRFQGEHAHPVGCRNPSKSRMGTKEATKIARYVVSFGKPVPRYIIAAASASSISASDAERASSCCASGSERDRSAAAASGGRVGTKRTGGDTCRTSGSDAPTCRIVSARTSPSTMRDRRKKAPSICTRSSERRCRSLNRAAEP